jgi:hypothetical protein
MELSLNKVRSRANIQTPTDANQVNLAIDENGILVAKTSAGEFIEVASQGAPTPIDLELNPLCPISVKGSVLVVSTTGKFGGVDGPEVESGDLIYCVEEVTTAADYATVGRNFIIVQGNVTLEQLNKVVVKLLESGDLTDIQTGSISAGNVITNFINTTDVQEPFAIQDMVGDPTPIVCESVECRTVISNFINTTGVQEPLVIRAMGGAPTPIECASVECKAIITPTSEEFLIVKDIDDNLTGIQVKKVITTKLETSNYVEIVDKNSNPMPLKAKTYELEAQAAPPAGTLGMMYAGTDNKLYFHNGTAWKEVSLVP